jgi:hypothetical protein
MAVGNDNPGVKVVMTSPDGATWTARTTPFDNGYLNTAWWDGRNWIVGGHNSARTRTIMTSPNGVIWTIRTTPFDAPKDGSANPFVWSIAGDGAGRLVAAGQAGYLAGPTVCTSTDHGLTWAACSTPFLPASGTSVPGYYVAWVPSVGLWMLGTGFRQSGPVVLATSPDAINWTPVTTPFNNPSWTGFSTPSGFVQAINQTGPGTVFPVRLTAAEVGDPDFIPVWESD